MRISLIKLCPTVFRLVGDFRLRIAVRRFLRLPAVLLRLSRLSGRLLLCASPVCFGFPALLRADAARTAQRQNKQNANPYFTHVSGSPSHPGMLHGGRIPDAPSRRRRKQHFISVYYTIAADDCQALPLVKVKFTKHGFEKSNPVTL